MSFASGSDLSGILSFSWNCSIFIKELKNHSMKRMSIVITTTQTLCVVLYCTFGIFGYMTFFSKVDGNVLNNYSIEDLVVDAGR